MTIHQEMRKVSILIIAFPRDKAMVDECLEHLKGSDELGDTKVVTQFTDDPFSETHPHTSVGSTDYFIDLRNPEIREIVPDATKLTEGILFYANLGC